MSEQHPDTRLAEILITEFFGDILVLGPDRGEIFPALAASAAEVILVEDEDSEEVGSELADLGAEVTIVAVDALEELEPVSGLLLARLPDEGAEEEVDRLLSCVADEGFVLVDLPPMPRPLRLRLERLIRSMLADVHELPEATEPGALVMAGRRKVRGLEYVCQFDRSPLPLTVFVYSRFADAALNLLILDLLYRQSIPPALVIVLDDAIDEGDRVPDDLWGLAGHSLTQPAILRTGGQGRVAALREGLGQLDTEFVAFLEAGERPASLWAERLCDLLIAEDAVDVAVAGAIESCEDGSLEEHAIGTGVGAGNLLAILLAGSPPRGGAMIFRDGPHLDLENTPAELDDAVVLAMLLRAAQTSDVGNMPLPLLAYGGEGPSSEARRAALDELAGVIDLERLEAGLGMFTAEDRAGLARHVMAGALHEVGSLDLAIGFYRQALAIEPDLVDLRIDLLRALRSSADPAAFLAEAESARADSATEPAYALALAAARSDSDRLEDLEDLLIPGSEEEPALLWSAAALAARRLGDAGLTGHLARLREHLSSDGAFGDLEELLVRLP